MGEPERLDLGTERRRRRDGNVVAGVRKRGGHWDQDVEVRGERLRCEEYAHAYSLPDTVSNPTST
jgi:hypothetical protein